MPSSFELDRQNGLRIEGRALTERSVSKWRTVRKYVNLPLSALLIFLALCVLGGGSSRADVLSLLYLRPAAVAVFAFFAWRCSDWSTIRPLALLLAMLFFTYLLQIVPLPPSLYGLLPGHSVLIDIQRLNGSASRWHSISLDPEATANAIMSLFVPASVLLGLGAIGPVAHQRLLLPVIGVLLSSAFLGLLQAVGGADSPFYIYYYTYPGYAVGWFANRNHQAAGLACLFPMLRIWAARPEGLLMGPVRNWTAATIAVLVLPLIFITGSRAGVVLGVAAMVLSIGIIPPDLSTSRYRHLAAVAAILLIVAVLIGSMILASRAASLDRLFHMGELADEGRLLYVPTEWQVLRAFWPFGVGAGAFDPAIRMFETDNLLLTTYFNHAHNDFFEMIIVAGAPGVLLVIAAVAMLARWTWASFYPYRPVGTGRALGRAGAMMLWIVVTASIVDYPLRSPLMGALMTIAAVWLRSGLKGQLPRRPSGCVDSGSL